MKRENYNILLFICLGLWRYDDLFTHSERPICLGHGPLEIFFFSKSCRVSKCSLFALVHSSYSILWKFFDFHAILATDKTNSLFSAYENARTKLGV